MVRVTRQCTRCERGLLRECWGRRPLPEFPLRRGCARGASTGKPAGGRRAARSERARGARSVRAAPRSCPIASPTAGVRTPPRPPSTTAGGSTPRQYAHTWSLIGSARVAAASSNDVPAPDPRLARSARTTGRRAALSYRTRPGGCGVTHAARRILRNSARDGAYSCRDFLKRKVSSPMRITIVSSTGIRLQSFIDLCDPVREKALRVGVRAAPGRPPGPASEPGGRSSSCEVGSPCPATHPASVSDSILVLPPCVLRRPGIVSITQ